MADDAPAPVDVDAIDPDEEITIWGIYCPISSQCKKGHKSICKKESEEEAPFVISLSCRATMSPPCGLGFI